MLNNEIIGEAAANLQRSDLAEVGLGDGRCGFSINFHRPIDVKYLPFVVVRLEGSDAELPRWAPTGFVEFFKSLYASYPMAGRSRSVFGGLWTDRTDAGAMLRGKVDIGVIREDEAAFIIGLIQDGVTILRDLPPIAVVSGLDLHLINSALPASVVRTIELILEDRPVVLNAEILRNHRPIGQASAELQLPSPAECLIVLAPLTAQGVQFDVVRESHRLPEFSRDGSSRWINPLTLRKDDVDLCLHGLLDRHVIQVNSLAIVGPGSLHITHCSSDTETLRLLVVPARGVPIRRLCEEGREEAVTSQGVRVWI
jgi:hypothetical protein